MSRPSLYTGRLAIQQRVLPDYRLPFFELLSRSCSGGMALFAGAPRLSEGIHPVSKAQFPLCEFARNIHLFGGPLYICCQSGLIRWLNEWNPDALILEANPRYLSTPQAVKWMHDRGRKVIGWGLGSPPAPGLMAGLNRSFKRAFISRFDALIAYSRRGAQEYAQLGFPEDRIFVAYNAVRPAPHEPLTMPNSRLQTIPTILFVGRLQQRKRVDLLLRACSALGSQPRLLIVGDGPEKKNLEDLAAAVYPQAEFVGAKRGEELNPLFRSADLFVLPGTGGLAVQEAMSHALPVIVAQGDGTQDDLVRESNGWQVPPGDLPGLTHAIQGALSDPDGLHHKGEESFRIVAQEINIGKMVEVFVQALNS